MLLDTKTTLFAGVRTWVFDLDNTLYPSTARLFDQINVQMSAFIVRTLGVGSEEADHLRRDLWARHGTTMAGLVAEHGVDADAFLDASHRLDLSGLAPDPELIRSLSALPGRKVVHTNGPRSHARGVLEACGLAGCFEQVIAVEDTGYRSKPTPEAFALAWRKAGLDPAQAAMVEDHADNLREPHSRGMRTIWLAPPETDEHPAHVDLKITDLPGFLGAVSR